ncbi:MAG: hypothetical protein ACE5GE_04365, partial [Phycisphaerae bacterium]
QIEDGVGRTLTNNQLEIAAPGVTIEKMSPPGGSGMSGNDSSGKRFARREARKARWATLCHTWGMCGKSDG